MCSTAQLVISPPQASRDWPPKVISVLTGGDLDDDSTVSVRYNGRCFHIHMSPRFLHNSPNATALYLRYLQAIRPDGSGEFDGVLDEDVYTWIIRLFNPVFKRLAPRPLPSFDPDAIRDGLAKPSLSDYLFPDTFGCRLDAQDEELIPRHTDNDGGLVPPRTWLDGDILDELERWASFFDPSDVEVYFSKPEYALDRMPTLVKVRLDNAGQTSTCYFKSFGSGITGGPLNRELDVYRNIHMSGLSEDISVGRLVGIVHEDKHDSTLGLLLRYINHRGTLYDAMEDNPTTQLRTKWAMQIEKAVHELHRIGSVWGDAKPDNILVDYNDNVWITDFEGGYTHGWVESDVAGTVEGDLQGLQRIIRFIFDGMHVDG